MYTGFFAYPSEPLPTAVTLERAISLINGAGYPINVKSWKSMSVDGKFIITEVCNAIDDSDVFLCDLTHINMNVLFELGYAIATDKPVWLSMDSSYYDKEKFGKQLGFLTTVGYRNYVNAEELMGWFLNDAPYNNLDRTLYKSKIEPIRETRRPPKLLYLKSAVATDASKDLSDLFKKSGISYLTDDPLETSNRPLEWYLESVYWSLGVIAHFLDRERDEKYPRNARYAFVCGLAYGSSIGKRPLMLAHSPYEPEIDYRDMMTVHMTPEQAIYAAKEWLSGIKDEFKRRSRVYRAHQRQMASAKALQEIDLGQYVAEDEVENLPDYFIDTASYVQALQTARYNIFVGRKGSGKTANLIRLEERLNRDQQKHFVCVIKPPDIELYGVFRLFSLSIAHDVMLRLIEGLWKFLVYTELALQVYENLKSKPEYYDFSPPEQSLIDYLDTEVTFIKASFTERMEKTIEELCHLDLSTSTVEQRQKINEIVHDNLISRLRDLLGQLLQSKNKVFVLIDNLDKAWEKQQDLTTLSNFLYGLLSVAEIISNEFYRKDSIRRRVDLVLILFLRSDIFSFIKANAREKSKLNYSPIKWNEPSLLQRVIEQRFLMTMEEEVLPEEIWERYFPEKIGGISAKDYLVQCVIQRPRDIIFLCKQALIHAIQHTHTRIEIEDITQAKKDYSNWVWSALLDETVAQFEDMESLLLEFAGASEIVTREVIETFAQKAGIKKEKTEDGIELLCEATFLGLEVEPDRFEFLYDEELKNPMKVQARKTAEMVGHERFKVNSPFHHYLGIKSAE